MKIDDNFMDAIAVAELNANIRALPRQERWEHMGYTPEQIQSHLEHERYKAQQTRERKKRNMERNRDIITIINRDLLNKTFYKQTIKKILPSIDGVGAWVHTNGEFGRERHWLNFSDYSFKYFTETVLQYN